MNLKLYLSGVDCSSSPTIMDMRRLILLVLAVLCAATAAPLRGRLVQDPGGTPAIKTSAGAMVAIEGDPESMAVLRDDRLAGAYMELLGEFKGAARFAVGSFYTSKSMFVHKDGKVYTISYWCPICSLRTYTPGKCMCCQEETHLDLQEHKQ
jgi:hypothetical protein